MEEMDFLRFYQLLLVEEALAVRLLERRVALVIL